MLLFILFCGFGVYFFYWDDIAYSLQAHLIPLLFFILDSSYVHVLLPCVPLLLLYQVTSNNLLGPCHELPDLNSLVSIFIFVLVFLILYIFSILDVIWVLLFLSIHEARRDGSAHVPYNESYFVSVKVEWSANPYETKISQARFWIAHSPSAVMRHSFVKSQPLFVLKYLSTRGISLLFCSSL